MDNAHPNHMQFGNRGYGEFQFIKLMAEEVEKGYTPGSTFNKKHQLYVYGKFRSMFGPLYSDRFLRSRFKQLKKRYLDFSEVLTHESIIWNRQTNIVEGDEELLKDRCKVYVHIFKFISLIIPTLISPSNIRDNRIYEHLINPNTTWLTFQRNRMNNGQFHGEEHYDLLCQIFESGVKFE